MSKYIDAEKLTTIIEERKAQQDQWINRYHDPINQGISHELTEILSIVDSLQQEQPEVDLEKEVSNYLKIHHLHIKDGGRIVFENDDTPNFMCDIRDIAHHFYELGKNSK